MKCTDCGFEQEGGKFCGQCGAAIPSENLDSPGIKQEVVRNATNESAGQDRNEKENGVEVSQSGNANQEYLQDSQAGDGNNDAMEKVKHTTKAYGSYFVEFLKHPSLIFSKREGTFNYGLISMAIVALLMALSTTLLVRSLFRLAYGDYGELFSDSYYVGPSVFSIFGYALIFVLISMAVIILLLYVVNQLFGTAYSFKEMTSVYGAHLVPVIVVTGIAFLLILVKSYTIGGYLLLIALGLLVTTFPIYLISSLLTRRSKNLDPLYGYLIYLVSMGLAFTIFVFILMDSTFGQILDEISYY